MRWGKKEQLICWISAYTPLLLLIAYRYIDANDFFKKEIFALWLGARINKDLFDLIVFVLIMIASYLIYKFTSNFFLGKYKDLLQSRENTAGTIIYIRKYNSLNANDYTFFLLTIIVPLVSIDPSSTINLLISIFIIVIAIIVFVKTDFINPCPIFFVSKFNIYRGTISFGEREEEVRNPALLKNVTIITELKDPVLDSRFVSLFLVRGVYYVTRQHQNGGTS